MYLNVTPAVLTHTTYLQLPAHKLQKQLSNMLHDMVVVSVRTFAEISPNDCCLLRSACGRVHDCYEWPEGETGCMCAYHQKDCLVQRAGDKEGHGHGAWAQMGAHHQAQQAACNDRSVDCAVSCFGPKFKRGAPTSYSNVGIFSTNIVGWL